MTAPIEDPNLEAECSTATFNSFEHRMLYSQAISLKRIADALQPIITGTPEPGPLAQINAAITGYVDALLRREHGGAAQDTAFAAICTAMDRFPTQEYDRRRAEKS